MKFRIQTWKLRVEGEFDTEEEAIEVLSDRYLTCSKCDQPGDHPLELLSGKGRREIEKIAKQVYFYVEEEVYGHLQWIQKYILIIPPFKSRHWWPNSKAKGDIESLIGDPFLLEWEDKKFRYKIVDE